MATSALYQKFKDMNVAPVKTKDALANTFERNPALAAEFISTGHGYQAWTELVDDLDESERLLPIQTSNRSLKTLDQIAIACRAPHEDDSDIDKMVKPKIDVKQAARMSSAEEFLPLLVEKEPTIAHRILKSMPDSHSQVLPNFTQKTMIALIPRVASNNPRLAAREIARLQISDIEKVNLIEATAKQSSAYAASLSTSQSILPRVGRVGLFLTRHIPFVQWLVNNIAPPAARLNKTSLFERVLRNIPGISVLVSLYRWFKPAKLQATCLNVETKVASLCHQSPNSKANKSKGRDSDTIWNSIKNQSRMITGEKWLALILSGHDARIKNVIQSDEKIREKILTALTLPESKLKVKPYYLLQFTSKSAVNELAFLLSFVEESHLKMQFHEVSNAANLLDELLAKAEKSNVDNEQIVGLVRQYPMLQTEAREKAITQVKDQYEKERALIDKEFDSAGMGDKADNNSVIGTTIHSVGDDHSDHARRYASRKNSLRSEQINELLRNLGSHTGLLPEPDQTRQYCQSEVPSENVNDYTAMYQRSEAPSVAIDTTMYNKSETLSLPDGETFQGDLPHFNESFIDENVTYARTEVPSTNVTPVKLPNDQLLEVTPNVDNRSRPQSTTGKVASALSLVLNPPNGSHISFNDTTVNSKQTVPLTPWDAPSNDEFEQYPQHEQVNDYARSEVASVVDLDPDLLPDNVEEDSTHRHMQLH